MLHINWNRLLCHLHLKDYSNIFKNASAKWFCCKLTLLNIINEYINNLNRGYSSPLIELSFYAVSFISYHYHYVSQFNWNISYRHLIYKESIQITQVRPTLKSFQCQLQKRQTFIRLYKCLVFYGSTNGNSYTAFVSLLSSYCKC